MGGATVRTSLQFAQQPANDGFADAIDVGRPSPGLGLYGERHQGGGRAQPRGDPGGHSVWYRFTPQRSGPVTLDTCSEFGTDHDTVLAVYTGSDVSALTEVASNDDAGGACPGTGLIPINRVTFTAQAGTTYRIAVDGKSGAVGKFELHATLPPANDAFADAVQLAPQPGDSGGTTRNATGEAGEPNHGAGSLGTSVWYRFTPDFSGPLYAQARCFETDWVLAAYTGSSVNALTAVGTIEAGTCADGLGGRLTLEVTAGTTYHLAVDAAEPLSGGSGPFTLRFRRDGPIGAPRVTTEPADSIGAREARLNGTVEPQSRPTSYRFEYGTTTAYGSQTAVQDAGDGAFNGPVVPAATVATGLQPSSVYHYRIVASNAAGEVRGTDRTFTTGEVIWIR